MRYATLRELIKHFEKKYRRQGKPSQRKAIRTLRDMAEKYGETTAIYDEQGLRDQSGQAIARRLALPPRVVINKMNIAYRYSLEYYKGSKL